MPDPFELDKEVEDFFKSGGNLPDPNTTPPADPALAAPPATPPAAAPAAPAAPAAAAPATPPAPALPTEDPAIAALRAQLGQLQNHSAQLERVIQGMTTAKPATPTAPAPDPETDPLGYVMHEVAESKKLIAAMAERFSQQDNSNAQTNELRAFVDNVQTMTAAFAAKQADYAQAYAYLRGVRTQDMKDLGVPAHQIGDMILKEELAVAARAIQQGINPAQMVYNIATRYGYKAAPPPPPPAQKIENLQNGQKATPPQVDPAVAPTLTLDSVKDMTSDQLDKLVDSNDMWAKIVGGKPEGNSIFH